MKRRKAFIRKCMAAALSCSMLMTVCAANTVVSSVSADGKYVINSDFESNRTGWGLYKESGGDATIGLKDGRLAIDITSTGKLSYSVQPNFEIVPLYQNGVYRLKFDVSSTVDRFIEEMIQINGGDYHSYTWKGINVTQEVQTIDYEFTMEEETDIMAKLCFNCGYQKADGDLPAHTIYFDNFTLELIDDSNVNYTTNEKDEQDIITNQVGFRPDTSKKVVLRGLTGVSEFSVVNADTKEVVYTGETTAPKAYTNADETDSIGDFSSVTQPGTYYIKSRGLKDSYTFTIADDVYTNLLDDTVKMFYLQRCGCEVKDSKFGHPVCHNTIATVYKTDKKIDVSGGWHDAGDYGRYTVAGAKAVADLLYAYLETPDLYGDGTGIPESGNSVPDILDEVRYELEWMLKMQDSDGGVYHKVTCDVFPGYVMPQDETKELIVMPKSTPATADFSASMALAAEVYAPFDAEFSSKCMQAAESAYEWVKSNERVLYSNPNDVVTGEYGDSIADDEIYWASLQMYRATAMVKNAPESEYLETAAKVNSKRRTGLDWSTVGDYGNIALLTMPGGVDRTTSVYKDAENAVLKQAKDFKSISNVVPYGVSLTSFAWGSNMTVANAGIICGIASRLTGDGSYLQAATLNLDYLLGQNPNAICFVTGYGSVSPEHPHHRPSMAVGSAMKGMLVGGVNSALEDPAAKAYLAGEPKAKCYIDNAESYSTNEITIYWNSPLVYLLSLTESTADTSKLGDVNCDGSIDIADLIKLQNYVLRRSDLSTTGASNADVCADGQIDAFDIAALRKILINK